MRSAMLSTLMLISIVLAVDFDGYISIRGGDFFRMQSNANINDNAGIIREMFRLNLGYNEIVQSFRLNYDFNDTEFYRDLNTAELEFENHIFYIALWPVPRIALRKTTFKITPDSFGFNHQSFAMAYPMIYASVPGVSDRFPENTNITWTKVLTGFDWSSINRSETIENGVQTWSFASCRTDISDMCISFKISNSTYGNDGTTFLPDSVKVDFKLPVVSSDGIQPTNVGVVSTVFYTDDAISSKDLHHDVDNTVQEASKKRNAKAMCSADFVIQFYSNLSNTGYVNWDRTATVVSTSGASSDISVDAHVFGMSSSIQDELNVSNADYWSFDSQLGSMTVMQYIVYDFPVPSDASYVSWDPEVGIAAVNLDNHVVGGGGLSAGAIAAIVICSVAVAGLVGYGGWKYYQHKKAAHNYHAVR